MAAEEDDYMSDIFTSSSVTVRPGLLTKSQKRKIKGTCLPSAKKKKIEDEKRQEGLATPLSKDNKGFTLLQKMGYKEGVGIGKSGKCVLLHSLCLLDTLHVLFQAVFKLV